MPKVELGVGWGKAVVGATYDELVKVFGEPSATQSYDDCRFPEWHSIGLQANITNKTNRANTLFVYASDPDSPQLGPADAVSDLGVAFGADEPALVAAHGEPKKRYGGENDDGTTWSRLVYNGGDFRFVDGRLVRMSLEKPKAKAKKK